METYQILLIVLAIAVLLAIIIKWRSICDWFESLGGQRVRNTAYGSFCGEEIGSSRNLLRVTLAPPLEIKKFFANLTRGDGKYKRGNGECGLGDTVSFRIDLTNSGVTAIPSNEIRIEDQLEGNARLLPGSVIANIGDGPDIPVPDEFIFREFGMNEISGAPDELPGKVTFYVRYRVRVVGDTVPAATPAAPTTTGPGPLA